MRVLVFGSLNIDHVYQVPHFLRPGGLFICSGILNTRLEEVKAAITAAGLTITAVNTMDDWCQITAIGQ